LDLNLNWAAGVRCLQIELPVLLGIRVTKDLKGNKRARKHEGVKQMKFRFLREEKEMPIAAVEKAAGKWSLGKNALGTRQSTNSLRAQMRGKKQCLKINLARS